MSEQGNPIDAVLDAATIEQLRYIMARLDNSTSRSAACKAAGISRHVIYKWDNLEELEETARLLARDAVKLRVATLAFAHSELVEAAPAAAQALIASLKDKVRRVSAAKEILDRVGIVSKTAIDVTTQGQPIALVEVVIPPGSDDDSEA